MARPNRQSPRRSDVPTFIPEGLAAESLEFKKAESSKERDHRLWKDKWSFSLNELGASIVALLVLIALVAFSFTTLIRAASTAEDRRFATSTLTAVGTAVAGFAFGKAKK